LSLDPPLELSTYSYSANNALTWVDPTGQLIPPRGGDNDGGIECQLVGEFVMALRWKSWLPAPIAMCIYDCNTSCPGSQDNILMKITPIFNPPYKCQPTYRRRLGE
jgi:hypothetical protein